jgi:hypothetical protein
VAYGAFSVAMIENTATKLNRESFILGCLLLFVTEDPTIYFIYYRDMYSLSLELHAFLIFMVNSFFISLSFV